MPWTSSATSTSAASASAVRPRRHARATMATTEAALISAAVQPSERASSPLQAEQRGGQPVQQRAGMGPALHRVGAGQRGVRGPHLRGAVGQAGPVAHREPRPPDQRQQRHQQRAEHQGDQSGEREAGRQAHGRGPGAVGLGRLGGLGGLGGVGRVGGGSVVDGCHAPPSCPAAAHRPALRVRPALAGDDIRPGEGGSVPRRAGRPSTVTPPSVFGEGTQMEPTAHLPAGGRP